MNPARTRYLPFAIFMVFIGLDQVAGFLIDRGFIGLAPTALYYLYPVKVIVVAGLLYRYRYAYSELTLKDLSKNPTTVAVCAMGCWCTCSGYGWIGPSVRPARVYSLLLLP